MEQNALCQRFQELREQSIEIRNTLAKILPDNVQQDLDLRLTTFDRLASLFELQHSLFCTEMSNPLHESSLAAQQWHHYQRTGFVQALFVTLDNAVKSTLTILDPKSAKSIANSFVKSYIELFTKHIDGMEKSVRVLKLFLYVRTTVSNQGIYVNLGNPKDDVLWRGKNYRFEHSEAPDFITWDFLQSLSRELLGLMRELFMSPELLNLKKTLRDDAFKKSFMM